jgi:hypothetical protein
MTGSTNSIISHLLGYGETSSPTHLEAYKFSSMAADLIEFDESRGYQH